MGDVEKGVTVITLVIESRRFTARLKATRLESALRQLFRFEPRQLHFFDVDSPIVSRKTSKGWNTPETFIL